MGEITEQTSVEQKITDLRSLIESFEVVAVEFSQKDTLRLHHDTAARYIARAQNFYRADEKGKCGLAFNTAHNSMENSINLAEMAGKDVGQYRETLKLIPKL